MLEPLFLFVCFLRLAYFQHLLISSNCGNERGLRHRNTWWLWLALPKWHPSIVRLFFEQRKEYYLQKKSIHVNEKENPQSRLLNLSLSVSVNFCGQPMLPANDDECSTHGSKPTELKPSRSLHPGVKCEWFRSFSALVKYLKRIHRPNANCSDRSGKVSFRQELQKWPTCSASWFSPEKKSPMCMKNGRTCKAWPNFFDRTKNKERQHILTITIIYSKMTASMMSARRCHKNVLSWEEATEWEMMFMALVCTSPAFSWFPCGQWRVAQYYVGVYMYGRCRTEN